MDITTKAQLEGLYKEVYGEKVENLIPESGKLIKMLPFREANKLGNAFNLPVIVSDEQGVTYAGADEDAFDLEAPEAMSTKPATVKGTQILVRSAIGYKAAAAAIAGGPKAFLNATELVIKRMMASISKRVEVMLLYGGSGLGVSDSSTNQGSTETRLLLTAASFAPGIWVGAKNARLDIYDSGENLINVVDAVKVVRVDIANRYLYISGDASDIADIDTANASGDLDLFYRGAFGKEALGLDKIITTEGELFGIDNDDFDLFKGQTFDAAGALTFDKVTHATVRLANYGAEGDMKLLVSPKSWQNLNQEQAATRNLDYSYSSDKVKNGTGKLEFFIQGMNVEIIAHPFLKEGEAFMVKEDVLRRVGAWDISTKTPGYGGEIFRQLEDKAAFELRGYTDQALFSEHPSWLLKITGIVNA